MKKVDKNVYHEARYGKRALIIFSGVLLAISIAVLGFGIALLVLGCKSDAAREIAWKVSVGVLLILLSLASGSISLVMLLTSFSMTNVDSGNVKDGNRAMGTVNVLKCDKCGIVLPDEATFCPKCGSSVEGTVLCECGAINNVESKYCTKCGKELKKISII